VAETDGPALVRAFLVAQASLTALVGTRIYAETATPPEGYDPGDGAAIAFRMRGGVDDYSDALQYASFQFKCYGSGANLWAQIVSARTVARALHNVLQNGQSASWRGARREVLPQVLQEPSTGWVYALTFYQISIANSD
jgi:hypothetical protein